MIGSYRVSRDHLFCFHIVLISVVRFPPTGGPGIWLGGEQSLADKLMGKFYRAENDAREGLERQPVAYGRVRDLKNSTHQNALTTERKT